MKTVTCLLALICTTSFALAGAAPYVGIALGAAGSPDEHFTAANGSTPYSGEFKDGGGGLLEAAFGIDFDSVPFRFEAALGVLVQTIDSIAWDGGPLVQVDDSAIGYSSLMFNGYVDIPTGTFLEPYLFAGIGRATVFTELDNEQVNDNVGAVQVGAGVGIVMTDYFIIDLKVRHFETGDYSLSQGPYRLDSEFSSNQMIAGFRVRF